MCAELSVSLCGYNGQSRISSLNVCHSDPTACHRQKNIPRAWKIPPPLKNKNKISKSSGRWIKKKKPNNFQVYLINIEIVFSWMWRFFLPVTHLHRWSLQAMTSDLFFFPLAEKPVWRSWFEQNDDGWFSHIIDQILLIVGLLSATCALQQVKYIFLKVIFSDCLFSSCLERQFLIKSTSLPSQITFTNCGKRFFIYNELQAFSVIISICKKINKNEVPYYSESHVRNFLAP